MRPWLPSIEWVEEMIAQGKEITILTGPLTQAVAHDPWDRDKVIAAHAETMKRIAAAALERKAAE